MTLRYSTQNLRELSEQGLGAKLSVPVKRKKRGNEESRMQREVIRFWKAFAKEQEPSLPENLLFAIPNGSVLGHGKEEYQVRHRQIRGKLLKLEGLRPGVFDLFLSVARKGVHGMYIELKAGDNQTSKEQDMFMYDVRSEGYCAVVCWSAEEAIQNIKHYLS